MAYAVVQTFMTKLEQLIHCNDIPVINIPSIIREWPQFQLLYEELGSMIQTLSNHEDQDLHNFEEVVELRKRFKAAAEEAEYIVDIFLSAVHFRNNGYIRFKELKDCRCSKLLELPTDRTKYWKKCLWGLIVMLRIRDKLVEDGKHLDVVSIVGMGGLGKTTLANKVLNDPFVKYHFYVCGWVTVSQTYDKRDLLIQVLSSIDDQLDLKEATDSQLHQMLHRSLYRKRYLIMIDEIWSKESWDKPKLFFPDHNNGSRILLTSRLTEVSLHANSSHGLIHHLQHLTKEKSWELMCRKVFRGDECPEWLIEPGMQIAKSCHGLPLSLVVMAGVLAKESRTKDLWLTISCSVNSYIASDEKGSLETIALSYHHLPLHLRDWFLYFGEFPEDYKFNSPAFLHLWMSEGFIQEDGNRSLEEIANGYLIDLVDRNLIIAVSRYSSGEVHICKVHDLVRQVCVEKGKEERFFHSPPSNHLCEEVITTHKQRHMYRDHEIDIISLSRPSTPSIRSLMSDDRKTTLLYNVSDFFQSFALLRVLKLENCESVEISPSVALLIHLRYLNIWQSSFPPSICNLWNLQTLFLGKSFRSIVLPRNISNLINLKHIGSSADMYLPSIEKPMKLEVISNVVLGKGVDNFEKCFPCIKDLTTTLYSDDENDFEGLIYLKRLELIGSGSRRRKIAKLKFLGGEPKMRKNHIIRFPATLEILGLKRCRLPWSEMLIIQSLPNLEALLLRENAFRGTRWETGEEQFQQLKVLRLEMLNIKQWEASSINFPCLRQLHVVNCFDLEEIPLELGDISTLELIYVKNCSASLLVSLQKIREEQDDVGNCELKIKVDGRYLTYSEHQDD